MCFIERKIEEVELERRRAAQKHHQAQLLRESLREIALRDAAKQVASLMQREMFRGHEG